MSICPVCETPLVTSVCEMCGHALPVTGAPAVPVVPLTDLETAPTAGGPTPAIAFPELEPTRFASADVPETWSEVEWERNRVAEVPDVMAGGLVDLDTGREAPDGQRTPPTVAAVTCRYCRNVQATGLLCERCGLRLPWSQPAPRGASALDTEAWVRCAQCGVRTLPGRRCLGCGSVLGAEL